MTINTIEPTLSTILRMEGVYKSFGVSTALDDVNFELNAREIHGLLGGNGAGKTTLMNILYGLYRMDAGEVILHGRYVDIHSPKDALRHKIGMVHQHFLQINSFTVIENIILGTSAKARFSLNLTDEEKKLTALADRFGLDVDLHAVIEDLPIGVRQKVEILKALYRGVEILILDEPTTNLTPQEVDMLFQSLRAMVDEGLSIVFITHKLREVLSVCDRITVLRNGKNALTLMREAASEEEFVRAMVGEELNIEESIIFSERGLEFTSQPDNLQAVLQVDGLRLVSEDETVRLNNIDLQICAGDIYGIAGVAENGQGELAEVLVGMRQPTAGRIWLKGEDIRSKPTQELLEMGISYIPGDRLHDGFLPRANVAQNLILGFHHQKPYSTKGFMDWRAILRAARQMILQFNIKTEGPEEMGANLSGGNIQRVMIARACAHPSMMLIAHNPTRGLDIPSMDFFYSTLVERKKKGYSTLLISENLDELLLLCDKIAVIYSGEIMGVLDRGEFEKYEIGRMMSGVREDA
ncbi:MAG: ABC transporter ATP-binding protein [Acidobacteriaceae bacterium]